MNNNFFIKIFAAVLLISLSSCQNYYQTKETERNEILRIFRGFKSVDYIQTDNFAQGNKQYQFVSSSFDSYGNDYTASQFDSLLFEIEGLKNASSKLYLDDFVYIILYNKEKDAINIWFDDTSGAIFQNGQWIESDNSHDLFSNW